LFHHDKLTHAPLRELFSLPSVVALIISVIGFFAVAGIFFYLEHTSERAINAQNELVSEYQQISRPTWSIGFQYSASHKMQQVLVTEKFRSDRSVDDIKGFYNAQLAMNGWIFLCQKPPGERKSADMILYFQKGPYTAAVEIQNDPARAGYSYSLNLSWGLHRPEADLSTTRERTNCDKILVLTNASVFASLRSARRSGKPFDY
jgi:hypothetical protein